MIKKVLMWFFILAFLGSVLSGSLIYYQSTRPLISPLSQLLSPIATAIGLPLPNTKKTQKIIYGFLPFWNFNEASHIRFNRITHLAYFGLDFDTGGNIIKKDPQGYTDPGWSKLNSLSGQNIFQATKNNKGKTIIVLRAMTQDVIESIVNSPSKRQKVIASTLTVLSDNNFDGINIDFEYAGTPDENTRRNYSTFVEEISTACKIKKSTCEVSIDVFADSASKYRIWDFAKITPHVDLVIVMAYDFFRSSSTQAGPVAPLRGACSSTPQDNCLDYDVSQTIADFIKIIPANKILLGIPYYGYQWQTATTDFLSNTYPKSGSTATFKRIQDILSQKDEPQQLSEKQSVIGIQSYWDSNSFSSRITFEEPPGQIQQIYYDDEHALSLKYDLVNQAGLAGIAIWALGYDGEYPQLWQLLEQKFFTP